MATHRRRAVERAVLAWVAATALTVGSGPVPSRAQAASPAATETGPVVVELFTSQGCSSCPPADRLLSTLGRSEEWSGRIVPLAYHVDYWNYIGWTDPFSSADFSARQSRYATVFGSDRVYTPQAVVAGETDCVGSRRDCILGAVERRASRPPVARVGLATAGQVGDDWPVEVEVFRGVTGKGPLDLWLAVVESDLETPVRRGENARRTLHNDFVVRRLERAAAVDGSTIRVRRVLVLEPAWRRPSLRVVAFVQNPRTLAIGGAAILSAADRSVAPSPP